MNVNLGIYSVLSTSKKQTCVTYEQNKDHVSVQSVVQDMSDHLVRDKRASTFSLPLYFTWHSPPLASQSGLLCLMLTSDNTFLQLHLLPGCSRQWKTSSHKSQRSSLWANPAWLPSTDISNFELSRKDCFHTHVIHRFSLKHDEVISSKRGTLTNRPEDWIISSLTPLP